MKKNNKYSVLMSVYKNDDPTFLKMALRSIYEDQTVKPDEIVVVFDGPIPNTLHEVLDAFREGKESIVFFYPQEMNKGLGEALRIGASYCTGDYIFRMDSDDVSCPERFEKQIEYVETHPEVDVVGADISEFNINPAEVNQRKRVCYEGHKDIVHMSKHRNPMNHVSVCIKRDALDKAGGYLPLRYVEDYYLWLRMIKAGCILANINQTLVWVRVGNGFAVRRGYKEQVSSWKTLQQFMIENKMISRIDAMANMVYIRCFVNAPAWMKKVAYSLVLRK